MRRLRIEFQALLGDKVSILNDLTADHRVQIIQSLRTAVTALVEKAFGNTVFRVEIEEDDLIMLQLKYNIVIISTEVQYE